jgi:hypothetical protein
MNIDTQIARVKELIAKREEIDAELSVVFGIEPKTRKAPRCSICDSEGHSARTCPQKQEDKSTEPV